MFEHWYILFILFGVCLLIDRKRMSFLEPYRGLFTVIGGSAAVLTFDLVAPVESWIKIVFSGGVICSIIATYAWNHRKRKQEQEKRFIFPSGSLRDENLTFTNDQLRSFKKKWWHCKGYRYDT